MVDLSTGTIERLFYTQVRDLTLRTVNAAVNAEQR